MKDEEGFEQYKKEAFDYAMRYLALGLSIIPIRFSDKTPAIEWKQYQTQQVEEHIVTGWFEDGVPDGKGGLTKAFGLGIVTGEISNLVVCDCDNQEALTYAVTEAGLFSLLTVSTTRGQHIYFRHPGHAVQNKAGGQGRDWPAVTGLDLRGDGGYVLAPPSIKFNEDGSFKHQYRFNCPEEEVENFLGTIPVWPGIKLRVAPETQGDFDFGKLDLSAIATKTYGAGVWEDMALRVKQLGRKLRDGDGRNPWLVRYLGECIACGMDETQAREASAQFQEAYYEPHLPAEESETVLMSVVNTDKRNHPEKYKKLEEYNTKNEQRAGREEAIRLITPKNLGKLKAMNAGMEYLINPFIPPESIVQVVGFNGHGKSLWLLNLLWAASKGISFGSGYIEKPLRCLYLDFEGSQSTLTERATQCESLIGAMDENLSIWSASISGDDMCLTDGEAIKRMGKLIDETTPQIVVIDTVRQAWSGMEENSPQSWVKVNNIAMQIRNAGMSVVLVHHRNKPNQQGYGREAGSTAQLKDLDVQIMVTKVVRGSEAAQAEAAKPDAATSIVDAAGNVNTAWNYLQRTVPNGYLMRYVFELSFGKLRKATENTIPTYVGMAEDMATGNWVTAHSMTPIQKAHALVSHGRSLDEISAITGVSKPTVQRWIAKKGI